MINSDEKSRLIAAYSTVSYAPESGMSAGEIADTCRRIAAEKHKSHRRRKAEMIAFLLRNSRLSVNGDTYFVDGIEGGNVIRYEIRGLWEREL